MKTSEALKLVGGLSKPSKMPRMGLWFTCQRMQDWPQAGEGSRQHLRGLLRSKGCYVFKVVQEAQYRRTGQHQA